MAKKTKKEYNTFVDMATGKDKTIVTVYEVEKDKQLGKIIGQYQDGLKCVGGIIGDIIGQRFENKPVKYKPLVVLSPASHFTDDTVMTCAIMDWLVNGGDLGSILIKWANSHKDVKYGALFMRWMDRMDKVPNNSYGNGCAMRVSPIGWVANTIEECMDMAKESAIVTHNHPEGIEGAQAVASAVFMARNKKTKEEIKEFIQSKFNYNLNRKLIDFQGDYYYHVSCHLSIPEAIICFLEGCDYADCVRNVISLGGDADTQANIAGAIAEAYGYEPLEYAYSTILTKKLTDDMKETIVNFNEKFIR